ncbi:MAG: hypothetical protein D6714_15085 [Bacteroidetes bacterium]|nr:MAG: hypothetical protein D6714_15085 [Bacteroidota bacterium]
MADVFILFCGKNGWFGLVLSGGRRFPVSRLLPARVAFEVEVEVESESESELVFRLELKLKLKLKLTPPKTPAFAHALLVT